MDLVYPCFLIIVKQPAAEKKVVESQKAVVVSTVKWQLKAQRVINLEIPVLVRSLKSSNVELG